MDVRDVLGFLWDVVQDAKRIDRVEGSREFVLEELVVYDLGCGQIV